MSGARGPVIGPVPPAAPGGSGRRVINAGNLGAAYTLTLVENDDVLLVGTLNANCTLTIEAAAGAVFDIEATQDATAGRVLTLPGGRTVTSPLAGQVHTITGYCRDASTVRAFVVGPATPPLRQYVFRAGGAAAWTNMPAAITELYGAVYTRHRGDFDGTSEARLLVQTTTVGTAAATVRVQYSLDNGGAWLDLDGIGTGGPGAVSIAAVGTVRSAWFPTAASARVDGVLLRTVGEGGDGVLDPGLAIVMLDVR